ncbi:alanine--tRNA ligase [Halolactibacillus alkaliphilus]|uniref:Alanine--tRNA ligase n=1 Tax=Halolactibacillus alkaliphilus TaxID=442899 RepID=A0A511WZD0_9BACI|nr:alanine--tRNA ligase [Halolactibacillus alkaliphilus]GEN56051.1 alanine--tRNA ligase [Halolactibacillus alkaliphilus]GGN67945.1 alanine--tRNA ligase [Halolactibacillus alkaliphilus]SFO70142.1 alanyl-tRNA synthetase [Halolactibacillus alkaliphilus]
MKALTSSEVRQMFLDFFESKGHRVEPSASLIPQEDPTLLWINSGVATLKKYFDGRVIPENPRITNAQKSIRTNDIENVGYTPRHHTFFEMLGNFSIGDYFKEEAIKYAWEFLTSDKWIGFDPEKISVTVHPEDDEAFHYWKDAIKLPEERIIRLEENFWDIGEGPSGPNTEIFYDRGEAYGNNPEDPELYPGGENDRYLEIWNLVFSQYNHNPDDTYTPLPKKNIDTGMGLERMVSVIQGTETNFETDLFLPIIKEVEKLTSYNYGDSKETDTAFKVISDHIRTVSFAVGDGALPSNEGRGYVLRRLLRRAVRFSKQLGIERAFMASLVPTVASIMEAFYPEVKQKQAFIMNVIQTEEERFHETLHDGLIILSEIIDEQKKKNETVVPGAYVFKLYDTYGFPKELTEEYAHEKGFTIDEAGFAEEMQKQRERARNARQKVDSMQVQDGVFSELTRESTFVGYDQYLVNTTVVSIIENQTFVEQTGGKTAFIVLAETPFYAESGGQQSDLGIIFNDTFKALVKEVKKAPKGQHLHRVEIVQGHLTLDSSVSAEIDQTRRLLTEKNHTATHLLHQALKDVLGTHVNQAGSLVDDGRLRFDFSHFSAVTAEELHLVESKVNEQIWASLPVDIAHYSIDEAKAMGAMALFGEKYGDVVRVVKVGEYSLELCGGCHVNNTAEIGLFKLVSESGIGAGTRRIEAVTAKGAYEFVSNQERALKEAGHLLKATPLAVPEKLDQLFKEFKQLQKEYDTLQQKLSTQEAKNILDKIEQINEVSCLIEQVNVSDMNQLRAMVDDLKQKMPSGIILLATTNDGKVQFASGVSKDLVARGYHAGKLIKQAATICGGGGGGRPDMAQAGGKSPEKIQEALQEVKTMISSIG